MKKISSHGFFLLALLVLAFLAFYPLLGSTVPVFGNDFTENHLNYYFLLKKAWSEGKLYAFWNPTVLSGTPLFAKLIAVGPFYPLNLFLIFLPRAYFAEKTVLVIGAREQVRQAAYGLMLDHRFNSASTAVIMAMDSRVAAQEGLERFDALVLTSGSIDGQAMARLESYVRGGGALLPDVVAGKNSVDEAGLAAFWQAVSTNRSHREVEALPVGYSPDRRSVRTEGKKGFLVLSEKFYLFGWKASPGNPPFLRANGVNTVIPVLRPADRLTVRYDSKTFRLGAGLSLVTLAAIAGIFILAARRKKMG